MTDEFETLRNLPPAPAPSAAARSHARLAAMEAFDGAEKNATGTQGKADAGRQSSILNRIRSFIMITRHPYLAGSALATLLVVPSATYLAFEVMRTSPPVVAHVASPAPEDASKPSTMTRNNVTPNEVEDFLNRQDAAGGPMPGESAALGGKKATAPAAAPMAELAPPPAPAPMTSRMAPAAGQRAQILLDPRVRPTEQSGDRFANAQINPVKSVATDPVSTFSIDVDTASYAFVRRSLMQGRLPDPDSVRVEEMVNYFPYDWPRPQSVDTPFQTTVTVTPTPWNAGTRLMNVAIKGYELTPAVAPPSNLVFLIDVSGSMNAPDKLPLLKSAFRLLVGKLRPEDKVSIVTYAGAAGTVLEPTSASESEKILNAIDTLQPGGSTAGAEGIEAAYRLAREAFVKDGVNRVMLATDGDFNVGASSDEDLKRMIEDRRRDGIYLSVLGFGQGNLNDGLMQTLAQNGNGTAAYIDTLAEAQKALVDEVGSTLFPIAKDVKIQVEFNPQKIAEYRLIGYETRALRNEDFNNDRVDAGDIGSGHSVTAIYEVTPKGSDAVLNDPLRYQPDAKTAPAQPSDELAFVKIRYKKPDADTSRLITTPVTEANAVNDLASAAPDVRFATAVAAFGQKLRKTPALEHYAYGSILDLARTGRGDDPFGYRAGFETLVGLAQSLDRK
ncbi:Ca-activated chloride channel family protein [Neorhizobium huautlense]|uniref:Ca-activated chloride channel family protein n=1 Tax=Neorhizobium huautlense TaxID=67774 RepID=A0ABT9PS30_9HYPH|nr:VWA domain-containing protein [Neorhizobium huautlense]MDP9837254.1 Ca-activated chloride channel family protein [Neorhizobium huautlense]